MEGAKEGTVMLPHVSDRAAGQRHWKRGAATAAAAMNNRWRPW